MDRHSRRHYYVIGGVARNGRADDRGNDDGRHRRMAIDYGIDGQGSFLQLPREPDTAKRAARFLGHCGPWSAR